MNIDIETINEILSNIVSPEFNKNLKLIQREDIHLGVSGSSYNSGGVQGESDQYAKIFSINNMDGIFLRVEYETDSYGDNDKATSMKLVKAKEKTVLVYE